MNSRISGASVGFAPSRGRPPNSPPASSSWSTICGRYLSVLSCRKNTEAKCGRRWFLLIAARLRNARTSAANSSTRSPRRVVPSGSRTSTVRRSAPSPASPPKNLFSSPGHQTIDPLLLNLTGTTHLRAARRVADALLPRKCTPRQPARTKRRQQLPSPLRHHEPPPISAAFLPRIDQLRAYCSSQVPTLSPRRPFATWHSRRRLHHSALEGFSRPRGEAVFGGGR